MSLQVWLPLNGSLENKGLGTLSSDFSISSPTYSAGKTGNNLKISNQQSNVVTIDELKNKKNVTISFWFCPNSGNTFGQWSDVISFGVSNGTTISSFRMEASSSTGKNFGWWGNNVLTTDGGCFQYNLNLDTWYHTTIVLNGTTIKRYINGELQGTFTIPTSYANNYYFTGTMTLGDASMYVSLADVRIYDECLSASRVSDIYDSLICHFDFNIPYKDQNLASIGSQCNFSGFNGTENQCPIFASVPIDTTRMVEGEKLAISFDATFSDFTVANGKSLVCYFQSFLEKNESVYWTTRLFETHGNFSKDVLAGGTFHYEWVQTIKSSVIEDLKLSTQCYLELRFDYAKSGKMNINNIFVKYGEETRANDYLGTDYIPESSGLQGGGVIHSSSKGLKYYYDSVIGNNCLDLRGTDYISAFQIKNFPQLKKSFTWNVWVKQEESNSLSPTAYQSILSYGRDWGGNTDTKAEMGMNISLNKGAPDIRYGHYDDENSSPNTNMQLLSSKKVNDGNWHMISTVMGDDGIMTLYIDGVKDMTASKATYCSYSHASGGFVVGKMSYNYYDTTQFFPFNGMIDDIKIFSAALTNEKIKKLYDVKAKIDKAENIYCGEFIENGDSFFMDASNQKVSNGLQVVKNGGDNIEIKLTSTKVWVSAEYDLTRYLTNGKTYKIYIQANKNCNKNLNDGTNNQYGRTYGCAEVYGTKISDGSVSKYGLGHIDLTSRSLEFTVDYSQYKKYVFYIFPNCMDSINCLKGNYIYENIYMVETNSDYNTNISKKSILTTGQIIENNDKTRIKKYNILETNEIIEN